jgi:hypothetical protein
MGSIDGRIARLLFVFKGRIALAVGLSLAASAMDAPRPGAERKIGDDVVEAVVVDTLETAPDDATHWSTRGLAAKHGISHQTVAEIWGRSDSNPGARTSSRSPRTRSW